MDNNHRRKGWNKLSFVKWAKIIQDLDRNDVNDVYKIKAIRDRLYFFFKPEFLEVTDIMVTLLMDSADNVSNFVVEVEPKDPESDPLESDDIAFLSKGIRSTRLTLDKYGFKALNGASKKLNGEEAYYMIDYGALGKRISFRKEFTQIIETQFESCGEEIDTQ